MSKNYTHQRCWWRKAVKTDSKHSLVIAGTGKQGDTWTATASSGVVSSGTLDQRVRTGTMTVDGASLAVEYWTVKRDSKTAAQRASDDQLRAASKATYLANKASKANGTAPATQAAAPAPA